MVVIAIVKTGSWMGVHVSVMCRKAWLQTICILENGLKRWRWTRETKMQSLWVLGLSDSPVTVPFPSGAAFN